MKGIQWQLSSFLKNNPISNHTASRVRLGNHSIPTGNRSVEVLSVWSRVGQSQYFFTLGPLGDPNEVLWGASPITTSHTSHWQLQNSGWVFQCKPVHSWAVFLTFFLKKIWSILGVESVRYTGGETGGCPAFPQSSHLPLTTTLSLQGWLERELSLLLPKCEAGQRTFPFGSRKPMDGWSQPAVWWLLYFSRHGVSRCDK